MVPSKIPTKADLRNISRTEKILPTESGKKTIELPSQETVQQYIKSGTENLYLAVIECSNNGEGD
jgi:hypothetical protein